MNSPFANIFQAISTQVQAAVTSITYIDQDLGQLRSGSRPSVSWPCLLIDFEDFTFDNLSTNVQAAKGTVVMRLGFAPYSGTSGVVPATYAATALAYYDIEYALHLALQGWRPGDEYGSLCRTAATTQRRTDSYRVREIRYSIAWEDYSTKPQQLYAPATLTATETFPVSGV